MKFKKITLILFLLLAILAIGTASASQDINASDALETGTADASQDINALDTLAMEETTEEPINSSDDDLMSDGDFGEDEKEDLEPTCDIPEMYCPGSDAAIVVGVPDDKWGFTGNVTISINDEEVYNEELACFDIEGEGGNCYYLRDYEFDGYGIYNVSVNYPGDDYSKGFTFNGSFEYCYLQFDIPKMIVDDGISFHYMKVTVPADANGNLHMLIDDEEFFNRTIADCIFDDETEFMISLNDVGFGNHNYTIIYTDGVNDFTKSVSFTVDYLFSVDPCDENAIPYGSDAVFQVEVPDGVSSITVECNNQSTVVDLDSDGLVHVGNLEFGLNTIRFICSNSDYPQKVIEYVTTVGPGIYIPQEAKYGGNDSIMLRLPSNASGNLKIYFGEDSQLVADIPLVGGVASYSVSNLTIGAYGDVRLEYTGSDYPVDADEVYGFSVCPGLLVPSPLNVDEDANVTVNVDDTGRHLVVYAREFMYDGWEYDYGDEMELYNGDDVGQINIPLNLDSGKYIFYLYYGGEAFYPLSADHSNSVIADIRSSDRKANMSLFIPETLDLCQDAEYFYYDVPHDYEGILKIYIDDELFKNCGPLQDYSFIGVLFLDFTSCSLQNHTWRAEFTDDPYYDDCIDGGTVDLLYDGGRDGVSIEMPGELYKDRLHFESLVTVHDLKGINGTIVIGINNETFSFNDTSGDMYAEIYWYDLEGIEAEYGTYNVTVQYLPQYTNKTFSENSLVGVTYGIGYEFSSDGVVIDSFEYGCENLIKVKAFADIDGNITVTVEGIELEFIGKDSWTYDTSIYYFKLDNISLGEHNFTISITGDSKCPDNSVGDYFELIPRAYLNPTSIGYAVGEDVLIYFESPNGTQGNVKFYVLGDLDYELVDTMGIPQNGKVTFNLGSLAAGIYGYQVTYSYGDVEFEKSLSFVVMPAELNIPVTAGPLNISEGDKIQINATLPVDEIEIGGEWVEVDSYCLEITVDENPVFYGDSFSSGSFTYDLENLAVGSHTIKFKYVCYPQGWDLLCAFKEFDVTVNELSKNEANLVVDASTIDLGDDAIIYITINENATGTVSVRVCECMPSIHSAQAADHEPYERTFNVTITDGKGNVTVSDLINSARYEVFATYIGNDLVLPDENFTSFNVLEDADLDVAVPEFIYLNETFTANISMKRVRGDDVITLEIQITPQPQGDVSHVAVLANGRNSTNWTYSEFSKGIYEIRVTFAGNEYYKPENVTRTFEVKEKLFDPELDVDVIPSVFTGQNVTVYVSLNPEITEGVSINVSGEIKSIDIVDGRGNYTFINVTPGYYTYEVSYEGSSKFEAKSKKVSFSVMARAITEVDIDVANVYIGQSAVVYLTFNCDLSGDAMLVTPNGNVSVEIVNGKGNYTISGLEVGEYNVSVIFDGNVGLTPANNSTSFKVSYYTPRIVAKDYTMYYNSGSYSVTVYGKDGKLASGTTVVFKIAGKKIGSAKANSKGVAALKIKQLPKTYKIVSQALGKSVTKKLVVRQVLVLKAVTVKKSAKKLVLTATLKKGKTAIKGKWIKFKFNGKNYKVKTDKKGIAKVTIKNTVLSKLKVGKKVAYQATYVKNTVKRTAKVKK